MEPDAAAPQQWERSPEQSRELALELLVHGVGGTTPERLLGDPRTVRITGDDTAGIYRSVDDVRAEERPGDYAERPVPEAYCWSNLTSGDGSRALWLLLLPFMVVNLAHWMRPAAPARHRAQALYDVLVRLIALSLTVLFTAAVCEVALDLLAWQCAGSADCSRGKFWLDVIAAESGGWWSLPGRRLALAALVPVLLIGLMWWLSHRTWSAYESASPPPRTPGTSSVTPDGERPVLSLPGFWYGRRIVSRLRAAHTAAALLTVASALLAASAQYDHRPGGSAALDTSAWALTAVLALGWVSAVVVATRKGRTETEADETLDQFSSTALPWAALSALVLVAVHTAWDRPGWTAGPQLPGNEIFAVTAVFQLALAACLACLALVLQRAAVTKAGLGHGLRTAMGGMGGAAVAALACGLGAVLSAGVAQLATEWLDRSTREGAAAGAVTGPPVLLVWQAAVVPPLLVVLALLAGVTAVRVVRERTRTTPAVIGIYDGESKALRARSKEIAGAITRAGITDSLPAFISWLTVLGLLLGGGALLGAVLTDEAPREAAKGAPAPLPALAEIAQEFGSWLMGAGVVLLFAMGRRAYRDAGARRTIGILWDVGTFWPRAAHPFAPPCYAERAVPDITWRMGTWIERTGGRLVLSGHSQGSVLAAAAVWQLDPATRNRVALLTYGSPLERLYGRWFPSYFGPAMLRALHDEVDRWSNLWRLTDPIGGPVLPSQEDPRSRLLRKSGREADNPVDYGPLPDPHAYGRTLLNPLPAPILGHSHYQFDPAFDQERSDLLAQFGPKRTVIPAPAPVPATAAAVGPPATGAARAVAGELTDGELTADGLDRG